MKKYKRIDEYFKKKIFAVMYIDEYNKEWFWNDFKGWTSNIKESTKMHVLKALELSKYYEDFLFKTEVIDISDVKVIDTNKYKK